MLSGFSRSGSPVRFSEGRERSPDTPEFSLVAICRILYYVCGSPGGSFGVHAVVATSRFDCPSENECNVSEGAMEGTRKPAIWWKGKTCGHVVTYIGLSSYERYSCRDKRCVIVEGRIREEDVAKINPIKLAIFKGSENGQDESRRTISSSRKKAKEKVGSDTASQTCDAHRPLSLKPYDNRKQPMS